MNEDAVKSREQKVREAKRQAEALGLSSSKKSKKKNKGAAVGGSAGGKGVALQDSAVAAKANQKPSNEVRVLIIASYVRCVCISSWFIINITTQNIIDQIVFSSKESESDEEEFIIDELEFDELFEADSDDDDNEEERVEVALLFNTIRYDRIA